jgi:uncharacterized protein
MSASPAPTQSALEAASASQLLAARAPGCLSVSVAYSPLACTASEMSFELPRGSCVADAVTVALGVVGMGAALTPPTALDEPGGADAVVAVGVWGKKASPQQLLHDGDRVEIYRPLRADPKLARRERFAAQGVRSAGLFSKKQIKPTLTPSQSAPDAAPICIPN